MSSAANSTFELDDARVAFLQGQVSINVAARDSRNIPSLIRAYGCRVSGDRRRVTVFLSVRRSQKLLDDLRQHRLIAAVFSRPGTHETIQLKGNDAAVAPLAAGDRDIMTAYADLIRTELMPLGYHEPFLSGLVSGAFEEAVSVTFTPTAAFLQTPSPRAGTALRA